jgi:predicted HNH restriction endonuclease
MKNDPYLRSLLKRKIEQIYPHGEFPRNWTEEDILTHQRKEIIHIATMVKHDIAAKGKDMLFYLKSRQPKYAAQKSGEISYLHGKYTKVQNILKEWDAQHPDYAGQELHPLPPSPTLEPQETEKNTLPNSYQKLVAVVENRESQTRGKRRTAETSRLARVDAARKAVLLRSAGTCENPACGGMPADAKEDGSPILEVDHVEDLALGGRDHPANMVALCPNCHAMKTYGTKREEFRTVLIKVAQESHAAWNSPAH